MLTVSAVISASVTSIVTAVNSTIITSIASTIIRTIVPILLLYSIVAAYSTKSRKHCLKSIILSTSNVFFYKLSI